MKKSIKFLSGLTGIALGSIISLSMYLNFTLPDKFYSSDSNKLNINCIIDIKGETKENSSEAQLKMFGVIPFKTVAVENIERPYLIPCGTPFGIKILTDGVIVTNFGDIGDDISSPAIKAGIEKGDIITAINGEKVSSANDMSRLVKKYRNNLEISINRNGRSKLVSMKAVTDKDGNYKLGIWIRDSTAGIGTMTFYDISAGVYGGLGHAVNDIDTGQRLPLSKGEIVPAVINNVIKGVSGSPGELCGTLSSGIFSGTIEENASCGLFGFADCCPIDSEPLPMALKQEVKTGEAYILTTVDGNTPQKYSIEIESIALNSKDNKNLVIRITDEKLIEKAGGIVQGMSGSPIIQNGMLVGAVTHVFVSDSQKGYGVFAETMFNETLKIKNGLKIAS